MKIRELALITLYGNGNYGNKLQNYAVEQILQNYGFNVFTLDCRQKDFVRYAKNVIHVLTGYHFSQNPAFRKSEIRKEILLKCFSKKHLHAVRMTNLNKIKRQFDFFCIGSDQVWNPAWMDDRTKHLMLMDFVDKSKKMTLSASFGVEELDSVWKVFFAKRLGDFEEISVREEAGAKMVNDLCHVKADVHIDPTLMLGAEKWAELAEKPAGYSREYIENSIVIYFLGNIDEDTKIRIQKTARKNELNIIALDRNDIEGGFVPSLEEWIYCIGHARLVMTDSFHGSVFSFLFDRNLLVFRRKDQNASMFSRIQTLLKKFEMEDRLETVCPQNKLLEHDYAIGYAILDKERAKLRDYVERNIQKA